MTKHSRQPTPQLPLCCSHPRSFRGRPEKVSNRPPTAQDCLKARPGDICSLLPIYSPKLTAYCQVSFDEDLPDFVRGEGSYTFRYVKLWLKNADPSNPYTVYFDAVAIPLTSVNVVCFAQDKSWAVISGNVGQDASDEIAVSGGIAENEFEQRSNWSTDWPSITYSHDSSIASPPGLPPSVNLVSLKRKGEG